MHNLSGMLPDINPPAPSIFEQAFHFGRYINYIYTHTHTQTHKYTLVNCIVSLAFSFSFASRFDIVVFGPIFTSFTLKQLSAYVG